MSSISRLTAVRHHCRQSIQKSTMSTIRSSSFHTPASSISASRHLQSVQSKRACISESSRVNSFISSPRHTTFHTSASRSILPAEPQHIQGTVNDPAPVPEPAPAHGSYHWTFERLISAALIPLTVAPFAAGSLNPITDAILCATILIHSHIGFQSIIIDYVPRRRLPKTRKAFWWGLRAATLTVAVGLYEFETTDVGVTEALKRIWTA